MLKRGTVVANRYVVNDLIGRGGMGRIYKVHDKALGEVVALKTLLPEFVKDDLILERFFNEARIARGLSHPNIVRVHDIGGTGDLIYISMEFLEGKSLRQLIDDLKPGQRIPINAVLRMFDALCAALAYAHEFTIHRDIKPENVMILPDGSVKLMDFGISKLMSNPNLTSASVVMGTPQYMSPEQLKNTSSVDARSDVYSLGIMLYEVITGIAPTALAKAASETSREVPPALDPIIGKCIEPNPAKRYQSAEELRAALREIRIAVEKGASQQDVLVPAARVEPDSGLRIAVGVGLILAIAGAAAWGVVRAEGQRHVILSDPGLSAASSTPMALAGPVFDFDRVTRLVEDALERGTAALAAYSVEDQEEVLSDVMEAGEQFWAEALGKEQVDPEGALERAIDAMTCFVAPVVWPEGMVFVTPGVASIGDVNGARVERWVDGFFIDAASVSTGEFWDFSDAGEVWRWPAAVPFAGGTVPMTQVTFYDALAYVASQEPAMHLPSEEQWVRAISEAQAGFTVSRRDRGAVVREDPQADDEAPLRSAKPFLYVNDDFEEWTRSAWGNSSAASDSTLRAGFRSPLVVLGGHFDGTDTFHRSLRRARLYETASVGLGFRGVLELPRSVEELAQLGL